MATQPPLLIDTTSWTLIGPGGYEYLVTPMDGSINLAFSASTPGNLVIGHPLSTPMVVTPPAGESLYAQASSKGQRVTVSRGNAA